MTQQTRNRTAVILINEAQEILLVPHMQDGKVTCWYPPGGGVDYLETVEDAAVREFLEETGLQVELVESLGYIQFIDEDQPWHSVTFVFQAKYLSGKLTAEESVYGTKMPVWFPLRELPDNLVPYLAPAVKQYAEQAVEQGSL